jgi:hypothetical protein
LEEDRRGGEDRRREWMKKGQKRTMYCSREGGKVKRARIGIRK